MGAAGVRHLSEKLLKLETFGSGALGVNKLIAYHIAVCPDKPDFGIELLLKKMLHEIGAGRFPFVPVTPITHISPAGSPK